MMKICDLKLKKDEEAVFLLRSLFEQYGYSQFKMNKFEEYELYAGNKDFLISDSIITFTDTNGKLMALKPDVTLSIVKNSGVESSTVEKVYYDENVYRVSKGTKSFKEIMQAGVECIGSIDSYCLYEVLMLACRSLLTLSEDAVLDLSHFGLLTSLLDSFDLSAASKKQLLIAVGEKNIHELDRIGSEAGLINEQKRILKLLVTTYGKPCSVLPVLREALLDYGVEKEIILLESLCSKLEERGFGDLLRIDFSVVNHTDYYNGIVFKGFLKGIPSSVLSGGQYDRLMKKMGHNAGAIGFAVYLDLLEELNTAPKKFDVDAVLLYDDAFSLDAVERAVCELSSKGLTVMAQRALPEKIRAKEIYRINESGVTLLERYA